MQGIYFMLVESMPYKYKIVLVFNSTTVFGWINFAIQFVAFMQVNRQCCETHDIFIIQVKWYMPHQGQIQGGDLPPKNLRKEIYSQWICTIRKTTFAIKGHFAFHCFATAVLQSMLHLSYSSEPAMRPDCQILLKLSPLTYWMDWLLCHIYHQWCNGWVDRGTNRPLAS